MGVGFIHDKMQVKFLILYNMSRVIQPVPMVVVQELTMIDGGFDYFTFAECLNELVQTEHLTLSEDGLYQITPKGVKNSAICESSLPYTVRLKADQELAQCNKDLLRKSQVQGRVVSRDNGSYAVELSLRDDVQSVMRLQIMVPDKASGEDLVQRFKKNPEQLFSKLISTLFDM